MSLRIRRGTNTERTTQYFDLAEPVWVTDSQKLYIGDGQSSENGTQGGINILASSAGEGLQFNHTTQQLDLNFADPAINTDDLSEGAVNRYFTDQRARTSAAALIMNGTSPNITYTLTTDQNGAEVLNTFIDFGAANLEGIQDAVAGMFQHAGNIDVLFSYDDSTGDLTATLDPTRVRYYAEAVLTEGTHTGLSMVYDSLNNVVNASIDDSYMQDLVAYSFTEAVQTDVMSLKDPVTKLVNLYLNTTRVKDIAAELFTTVGTPHQNISFSYVDGEVVATVIFPEYTTTVSEDSFPVLGGNLNLNSYNIIGSGNITTSGYVKLVPLDAEPDVSLVGAIALASGNNWDPAGYGNDYLVYSNGSNWIKLGTYERTRTFYVDSLRSSYGYTDGTVMYPYSSVTSAIAAANASNYDPAFIILMSDVNESIIISKNIQITGITTSDPHNSVKIVGTVTFDFDAALAGSENYASISNLRIDPISGSNAIEFSGVNTQIVKLTNLEINGTVLSNNSDLDSILIIEGCTIKNDNPFIETLIIQSKNTKINNSSILGTSTGLLANSSAIVKIVNSTIDVSALSSISIGSATVNLDGCTIKNNLLDSKGLDLISATSVVSVINCIFDIPVGLGKAVYGLSGSTFTYGNVVFRNGTNNDVSSDIGAGIVSLSTTFAQTAN